MSENKGSTMLEVTLAFLLGGAVGAALGVLFAPAAGKETREKIKDTRKRDVLRLILQITFEMRS